MTTHDVHLGLIVLIELFSVSLLYLLVLIELFLLGVTAELYERK